MAFDKKLLDIVACPVCKGKLEYNKEQDSLICHADRLVYPITEGIPVLLADRAEPLPAE
ncbi:Trm112 family protein [Shewanella sp. NIFS-20-20]|uniref:Trm112 family protein n=1 Tax=Shewanella sp. NIFS-20-20 TaxID=2853806 RepID=UPI001C43A4D0|nr:Trm112 family protein [Shewanella sp. NIFS-20-20]MBV7315512.1 Trm112 family protein [Shewanella sp. NIFS-20-20]